MGRTVLSLMLRISVQPPLLISCDRYQLPHSMSWCGGGRFEQYCHWAGDMYL